MPPALPHFIRDIVDSVPAPSRTEEAFDHLAEANKVFARDRHVPSVDPDSGVLDPHDINNVGFFVLFALIGVGIVITAIWFFFWAKNGGFYFEPEKDWDDYKTTVLRRRGPNGTILSGATPVTDLGGGSVYKDVDDDGHTCITESTALSGITAGASDIAAREKRKRKQERRDREKARKREEKKKQQQNSSKRHVGEEGVEDEDAEKAAKEELRNYRHEKAARVGGLNKESEGSQWDGSTNPTDSVVSSDVTSSSYHSAPPRSHQAGGIRKVYSVADRNADRERERNRAEARRVREENRIARRDFSYQRGAESSLSESLLEGSSSDLGTKSYHHPMPELREHTRQQREREREERRARRSGYRRNRDEDIRE